MSVDEVQLLNNKKSIRPILDIKDVKNLVKEYYGFNVVRIVELDGYDDKNYHIQVEQNDHDMVGYVFKVINSLDSAQPDIFEVQTSLLNHLGKDSQLFYILNIRGTFSTSCRP